MKSIGQMFVASLTDKKTVQLIGETRENGLLAIGRSRLAGKLKLVMQRNRVSTMLRDFHPPRMTQDWELVFEMKGRGK